MGINITRKRLAYLFLRTVANVIDRRNNSIQWRTLYFDQQSKGKKETIVMIAGAKAQTIKAKIGASPLMKWRSGYNKDTTQLLVTQI
jgi:hypothetical protein